ncbi:MAG: hypothetical protein K1Y36_02015 [Blastocatellia bacterium]|nr:hypothetical protein [Blastocatellia bacterium]
MSSTFKPSEFLVFPWWRRKTVSTATHIEPIWQNKTAHTLLFFAALAVFPYLVPGLEQLRVLLPAPVLALIQPHSTPVASVPVVEGNPVFAETPITAETQEVPPYASPQKIVTTPTHQTFAPAQPQAIPGAIEDPSGHALDHFFTALDQSQTEGQQVRITHYGDSPITNDGITSTVRRKLQERFGDAGHGFILIDKPWGWYGHLGVTQTPGDGWESQSMFISRGDHRFGLGGASFTAKAPNVTAKFSTVTDGTVGHTVSGFDVYYLAQPGGGDFDLLLDGTQYARVSTAGDSVKSAFFAVKAAEGPHTLQIRTVGNGEVRMFGITLQSSHPGIQYDSLGVNGAFIGLLTHYLDEEHWTQQLQHRQPDLVILNYGTNESEFENLPVKQYEADTKEAIRRIRAALPEVSIMLVSPMDRGMRAPGGGIMTRPMIPKLVSIQRKIAAETGCAFFDTFTAMGGEGTVAAWVAARPKLMGSDYTHPTWQGSEIVGSLISDAMVRAYENRKKN